MSNMFNKSGDLNAYNKKEALDQLVSYAQALATGPNSNSPVTEPSVSDGEKEALLSKAISTERGRVALAQAMAKAP